MSYEIIAMGTFIRNGMYMFIGIFLETKRTSFRRVSFVHLILRLKRKIWLSNLVRVFCSRFYQLLFLTTFANHRCEMFEVTLVSTRNKIIKVGII